MTPLALLASIQESLPPPPGPTATPDIDIARVVGVVILSLGLIVLLALSLRPLILKKPARPDPSPAPAPPPAANDLPEATTFSPGQRSIIPFPKTSAQGGAGDWAAESSRLKLEDRLDSVAGDRGRPRKLGDRQPSPPADFNATALHRVSDEPWDRRLSRGPLVPPAPVVPLHERRANATTRDSVDRAAARQEDDGAKSNGERVPPANATGVVTGTEIRGEEAPAAAAPPPVGMPEVEADVTLDQPRAAEAHHEPAFAPPAEAELPAGESVIDEAPASRGFVETGEAMLSEPQSAGPDSSRPIAAAGAENEQEDIDIQTLASISQTVRDLIYCANAGELLEGFVLYSDPFLFRFMDGTGMTEDEFRDTFSAIKPRPPEEWERLDRLSEVALLPGGAIEATVSYVDSAGKPLPGAERYRFVYDAEREFWAIDDIEPIGQRGS